MSTLQRPERQVPVSALQGVLTLVPDPGAVAFGSPAPAARTTLEQFVPRFCAVVVEVIGGDRSVHQLIRWTTSSVYEDLTRRTTALSHTVGRDQRLRRLRAQVRSIRIAWPSDDAAEVSVHVRHGERSRAIAARIELRDGRWVCSALQFG